MLGPCNILEFALQDISDGKTNWNEILFSILVVRITLLFIFNNLL